MKADYYKGLSTAVMVLLVSILENRGAVVESRSLRVRPDALRVFSTNMAKPPVKASITNETLKVRVPKDTVLMVRKGSGFVSSTAVRQEGTNALYELKPSDVYVVRPKNRPAVALTTNSMSLDTLRTTVNGQQIEGHVDVALRSELMVFDDTTRQFHGTLALCFRSADGAKAQNLLPITLDLFTTAGLRLASDTVTFTNVTEGCKDVEIQCSSERSGAKVTIKSSALADQEFTLNFDEPPVTTRYRNVITILAGVALGGLGGLVRTWQSSQVKHRWKRVAGGAFCGLVLVLLGQIGLQSLFHISEPVTTSTVLGLCAVLGYLGVRMLERMVPKDSEEKPDHSDAATH